VDRSLLMTTRIGVLIVAVLTASPAAAEKTVKQSVTFGGRSRTYYLFVADKAAPQAPAPLIVLLHGSGRNGLSLVERWDGLAKREGLILVGPDSINSAEWRTLEDGPAFIHDLVETLRGTLPIDPHRIYLFGHSAGAIHSLGLSLLESEYFAATAVHAGALPEEEYLWADAAARKIPIGIWVGTDDALFPLRAVRATRDFLNKQGFGVELTEIKGHTHNYYVRADEINKSVWQFLQKHRLEKDPKYQLHQFR
jgi:poly(3-hydroxybutyrate) depolymerase